MAENPQSKVREVEIEDAVYDVVPVLKTPQVDPGDPIRIGVYITGYGKIPRTKLSVFHGQPKIIDEETPGTVSYSVSGKINTEENEIFSMSGGEGLKVDDLSKSGITIGLAEPNFADDVYWGPPRDEYPDLREQLLPRIMGEGNYEGSAPIEFTFNTKSTAPAGDYSITMALTCATEDEITQSQAEVNTHINDHRERLEPLPTLAGIVTVILALLSLLIQSGILEYILSLF